MKGHHTGLIAIIAIAVIAGLVIYSNPELLKQANVSDKSGVPNTNSGTPQSDAKIQAYVGSLTMSTTLYNSLAPSTTLTDGTDATVIYWKKDANGKFINPITSSSNSGVIYVDETVKTVWAEITPSSSYYVDAKGFQDQSWRVQTPAWCDANTNNRNTFCFPIDVTGFEKDAGFAPTIKLGVPLFSKGTITMTSPSNQAALGQGKVGSEIKWEATASALAKAIAVNKITVTMNQTDSGMWFPLDSYVKLPVTLPNGKDKLYLGTDFVGTELASTYKYEYKFGGGDLNEALMLVVPNDGTTGIQFTSKIYTNFDADNEGVTVNLKLHYITSAGAESTTNDTVALLEQ